MQLDMHVSRGHVDLIALFPILRVFACTQVDVSLARWRISANA